SNYCWNSTGVALCGTSSSTISDPRTINIATDDTIYVAGHQTGVLKCTASQTSTSLATTAYGDHVDYISFDRNGSMYTNDHNDDTVRRYASGSSTGVLVAGAGSSATGTFARPVGTAIDDNFNLYVGDQDAKLVKKLAAGSSSLVTVINTASYIDKLSALLFPKDTSDRLFMSDENQKEVYLWKFNATAPSVTYTNVAGGTTLKKPRGLKLDPYGNLYVADNDNSRIVMYCVNSTTGIVITSISGKPEDLAFDSDMNLYVLTDTGKILKHSLL
ncbi:unnamed protein product, partial [Rotaria sordida]